MEVDELGYFVFEKTSNLVLASRFILDMIADDGLNEFLVSIFGIVIFTIIIT